VRAEVQGLNGGRKAFYLKQHRREILDCYYEHGLAYTLTEFNMGYIALENMLRDAVKSDPTLPAHDPEKEKLFIRLERIEIGVREVRGRQLQLEEAFNSFIPALANDIVKKLTVGMVDGLVRSINVPAALESTDLDVLEGGLMLNKKGEG
jgi:hypothetical protein